MSILILKTTDAYRNQWLMTLFALLLSAMAIAEQAVNVYSYKEWIKKSIYEDSGVWRAGTDTDANDWRVPEKRVEGRITMGFNYDYEEIRAREEASDARNTFDYDNSTQGYRIFKIDF